jgi:hypothetical protein
MNSWPPPYRTVEDYRYTAFDVQELYRHHVFDQPVGTYWRNCALGCAGSGSIPEVSSWSSVMVGA